MGRMSARTIMVAVIAVSMGGGQAQKASIEATMGWRNCRLPAASCATRCFSKHEEVCFSQISNPKKARNIERR
jgi:hypothetical protein